MKLGEGVPKPAKLDEVIDHFYKNQKVDNIGVRSYFSLASLNLTQMQSLTYPSGFEYHSKNIYIYNQNEEHNISDDTTTIQKNLIVLTKKNKIIYGIYFEVTGFDSLSRTELTESKHAIHMPTTSVFAASDYLESYHNIEGTKVLIGLSLNPDQIGANLQYSHKNKYYYEHLTASGVQDPFRDVGKLSGLSSNLEHLEKCHS